MPSMLRNPISTRHLLATLSLLASLFSASGAFAAAPEVVVDAQFIAQTGLNEPTSLTVAPNGTYYVADSLNNRVVAYTSSGSSNVNTGSFAVVNPQAVAVDSLGDLFIGYSPSSGVGQVIEAMATNGVLNGTVNLVVSGGALKDVTALDVDTNPGSSTLNTLYIGDDVSFTIYSVAAGTTTLVNLGLTGLPSNVLPAAIAKDASGNLYVADFNSTLYEVPAGSTAASIYNVPGFTVFSPTGLWIDPKGDLLILTYTATSATPSQTHPANIIEIPGGVTSSAFRIPITGLNNPSGLGADQQGHIYVSDNFNNNVTELIYGVPIGLSQVQVGKVGSPVTLNYAVNSAVTVRGFEFLSSGDISTEFQTASGGNCKNGNHTTGSDGTAISTADPYVCQENVAASPAYPGLRYGAVELEGTGTTILASTDVFATGIAGASVMYPLTASITASNINNPVGLVVSGLDKHLYLVNNSGSPEILRANSPSSTTFTRVSTAPVTLVAPFGIAIDGQGDLYIADSGGNPPGIGQIVVVPAAGQTPYGFNPGSLLNHPVAVSFDTAGDLFIGDLGPLGLNSDPSSPGYIVEVPAGGGPAFKVNTGSTQLYLPGAVAADPYTGAVLVGDIGYINSSNEVTGAKVVRIPAGGGSAIDIPQFDGTQPAAIVFDPAEEYYVLDGAANTLTVVPPTGSPSVVPITGSLINTPSSLAITNGGQNFVVGNTVNFGTGAENTVVYLNGKLATLAFGQVAVHTVSSPLTLTIKNIGSSSLTLEQFLASNGNSQYYQLQPSTTCATNGSLLILDPAASCNVVFAFAPTATGTFDVTGTLVTNGYLPEDSQALITGTGVSGTPGAIVGKDPGKFGAIERPRSQFNNFR